MFVILGQGVKWVGFDVYVVIYVQFLVDSEFVENGYCVGMVSIVVWNCFVVSVDGDVLSWIFVGIDYVGGVCVDVKVDS